MKELFKIYALLTNEMNRQAGILTRKRKKGKANEEKIIFKSAVALICAHNCHTHTYLTVYMQNSM